MHGTNVVGIRGHPQYESLKHSRSCGPQPEDFRSYHLLGSGVIIPSVEGVTGMIITDVVCETGVTTVNRQKWYRQRSPFKP